MKPNHSLLLVIISLTGIYSFICGDLRADEKTSSSGPAKGSLVIVGGGTTAPMLQRFIALAGGPDAPIVVIPTANGKDGSSDVSQFNKLGATKVSVLHTADPKVADTDSFVAPLLSAKGVWFGGGASMAVG